MATATTTVLAKKSTTGKKTGARGKKKAWVLPPYPLIRDETGSNSDNDNANDFLEGVANLLEGRKNIVVLVGAGISTSVGIPDFRSKDKGLYNTLDAAALGLSCPEDLFCIEFFKSNPSPFYKFAKHLYYPNKKEHNGNDQKTVPSKKKMKKPTPIANGRNGKGATAGTKPKPKTPLPVATRTSWRIKVRQQNTEEKQQQESQDPAMEPPQIPPPQRSSSTVQGTASPSDSHKLLALLEKRKMLLRVYTQNIDGLESSAGVSDSRIVYCHGSLRSMSCTRCSKKNLPLDRAILESIESGSVPFCKALVQSKTKTTATKQLDPTTTSLPISPTRTSTRKKRPRAAMDCYVESSGSTNGSETANTTTSAANAAFLVDGKPCCGGVLKPGITFFGETLDNSVGRKIESDQSKADALIVIGTSLSVAPISKVIEYLPKAIPRILINRTIVHPKRKTPTQSQTALSSGVSGPHENGCDKNNNNHTAEFRKNYVFDAYLLGFCDDVTRALGKQLGLGFNVEKNMKRTTKATAAPKAGRSTSSSNNQHHTKKAVQDLPPPQRPSYASDTGAKLLKGAVAEGQNRGNGTTNNEDPGWRLITVPKERVLLFPGALPSTVVSEGTKKRETSSNGTNNIPAIAADVSYQEIAHCDGCSKLIPIGRPIFKCSKCFDYDLCQSCHPRVSKLHCDGKHSFRKE